MQQSALAVTAGAQFRRGVTELPGATLSLPYPAAGGYVGSNAPGPGEDGPAFAWGREILEHPDFGLEDVAAIIVESVQGSGGMLAQAPAGSPSYASSPPGTESS